VSEPERGDSLLTSHSSLNQARTRVPGRWVRMSFLCWAIIAIIRATRTTGASYPARTSSAEPG
jgi:hypothetical protein